MLCALDADMYIFVLLMLILSSLWLCIWLHMISILSICWDYQFWSSCLYVSMDWKDMIGLFWMGRAYFSWYFLHIFLKSDVWIRLGTLAKNRMGGYFEYANAYLQNVILSLYGWYEIMLFFSWKKKYIKNIASYEITLLFIIIILYLYN